MQTIQKFLGVVSLMVFTTALAFGQAATTGTITGTTSDSSGALIPGVNVILKFPARISDQELATVTDERGTFRFPAVPTAVGYQLRAELTGFRTKVISEVEVRPAITQNFAIVLEVGALTEEVTVTAESPLINLDSARVSEGLNEAITSQVPLVRRDFTEIAQLFQGIQHSAADDSGFFVQFHARGGATTSNGYRVDGMTVNYQGHGRVGARLTMTAIQNIEFVTGSFNAEYGEQPNSMVTMVTKSGGNDSFFDYTFLYRPEALTSKIKSGLSNQVFDKSKGMAHFEEFAFGGSLVRDKLFYFNAFQYEDEDLGNLVAPKTRHSYFTSEFLKLTYSRNSNDRWDFSGHINQGNQHRTGYRTFTTSEESESQQRCTIPQYNVKNTRTYGARTVLEIAGFLNRRRATARLKQRSITVKEHSAGRYGRSTRSRIGPSTPRSQRDLRPSSRPVLATRRSHAA